ncbi:cell wall hydrolase [Novosphingobium naphthalenivorans]|uniref:cell wall hydrolase n=1 Tax=Novosphingobium naphthalenivorans TaxID=273168 RepID=UPI000833F830|nr:cell wall hydrolase [Novosphingobium naphthalenivorans]
MPAAALFSDPLWAEWEEARPRDFAARFARRARGAGHKPLKMQRRWTLGVTALAAIALPAFAAPDEWNRFQIADAVEQDGTVAPMPFEQAGSSFPGSAFYYLEAEQSVPQVGEGIHSDADDSVSGPSLGKGPSARPLYIDNSGVDRTRALQCMTAAIYYEAASESDAGQRAVAQVVLNRVAHPAFPNTVCGVVYQGSERPTGCQFSFTCDGSLARRPSALFWNRAETIARQALAGYVYAPVGLATHYHTVQVSPYWAPSLHYLGTIGEHRFYSFNGPAGNPATFRYAYAGGEPAARPAARTNLAEPDPALDPVTLQRAFAAAQPPQPAETLAAAPAAVPAPAVPNYTRDVRERGGDAVYRAQSLPEAHGIKPEFANSGRWIAQPGS